MQPHQRLAVQTQQLPRLSPQEVRLPGTNHVTFNVGEGTSLELHLVPAGCVVPSSDHQRPPSIIHGQRLCLMHRSALLAAWAWTWTRVGRENSTWNKTPARPFPCPEQHKTASALGHGCRWLFSFRAFQPAAGMLLELGHRAWQQLNDPPAPAPLHPSKARHSNCSEYGVVNGQVHAWQQGFPGTRNNLTGSHWRIA